MKCYSIGLNVWERDAKMMFIKSAYVRDDSLAIQVWGAFEDDDDPDMFMPFCTLTVNLGLPHPLPTNCAFVDVNNCPVELIEKLEEMGVMTETDTHVRSGYVVYPMYKFDDEWIETMHERH